MDPLLTWAIENTSSSELEAFKDRLSADEHQKERLEWLKDAMNEAKDSQRSSIGELSLISVLAGQKERTKESADALLKHLDLLRDFCEEIHNADTIVKNNGLEYLLTVVRQDWPCDVRASALWTIGTILQNNPDGQAVFTALSGFVDAIFDSLRDSSGLVWTKAVYVLSSGISHPQWLDAFINNEKNWSTLADLLRSSLSDLVHDIQSPRLKKLTFFLRKLGRLAPTTISSWDASVGDFIRILESSIASCQQQQQHNSISLNDLVSTPYEDTLFFIQTWLRTSPSTKIDVFMSAMGGEDSRFKDLIAPVINSSKKSVKSGGSDDNAELIAFVRTLVGIVKLWNKKNQKSQKQNEKKAS